MGYAFYIGCATPAKALHYELSTRALAGSLGIELIDVPEFGCCGFPVKSMDSFAALLMAARNLALAEEKGMDIIGVCTGCIAVLSEAKEALKEEKFRREVNERLRVLGVKEYSGKVSVKHFARFLCEDYGLNRMRERIVAPLEALRVGVHYGCHYMRPARAHGYFDDPSYPRTLDELVLVAGAKTIDYPNKNLCCGLTIMGAAEDLSFKLAAGKLECLSSRGADAMLVACPSCGIAYDNNQKLAGKRTGGEFNLPVLYFTQALGLAMGLDKGALGIEMNRVKVDKLMEKLIAPPSAKPK